MGVTLKALTETLGGELIGNDIEVERVSSITNAQAGSITFIADSKYRENLRASKASAVILSSEDKGFSDIPHIVTDNPYAYFAQVSAILNPIIKTPSGIHPSAVVDNESNISKSCAIGPKAVIGKNVNLNDGVIIGAGCYVGDNVSIGKSSQLEPNVTIYSDTKIGDNCHIFAGAVVGSDGFGYANQEGLWIKIPQVGRVIIGNNVDVGSNTTIDRGALDNTIIEDGVKLDNLVQIGHNCVIGEHTVIAGCVGIAGSARVGKRCRIGGAAMILGHLDIADDITISPGSMITRSLIKSDTYTALMPFQTHENWLKTAANLRHLTDLNEKFKLLEKQLAAIKSKN